MKTQFVYSRQTAFEEKDIDEVDNVFNVIINEL